MPSVVFAGSKVKALKDRMSLNDVTEIISVNADPASGAGVAAPLGSIAMDYLAGKVYKKTGSLATEWQELGSGIGGINYIENPDAESGTTGWSTYADAAGAAPVDGTGGTANITWSRSTTSPLRGVADFNLVKDAVNRQGQGVSYDFTIDSADQAKILTISADYEVLSGTFATGDLAVYVIQDPAGTPVVLQPAGYQVTAGTNGNKLRLAATFQTASNVTSYRLCIHVASVSALAYTLAFDSIAVSPQQVVYGAPVTDWQSYTPTFGGVTATSVDVKYRRVGDSIEVIGKFDTSAVAASTFTISLPAGLSVDTAKLTGDRTATLGAILRSQSVSSTYPSSGVGPWNITYSSTAGANVVTAASSIQDSGSFIYSPTNGSALFNSGDSGTFEFRVPILGWSSSVVVSSSTDTRVVAAQVTGDPASAAANNPIIFPTTTYDTHGAYNVSTGRYTAPVPGFYRVSGFAISVTAGTSLAIFVNGTQRVLVGNTDSNGEVSYTGTVQVNAGDLIDLRPLGTLDLQSGSTLCVERLSGPSQIAASETVAASYWCSANASTSTSTPINFDSREFDTHGAVTTGASWKFTAPVSGTYLVNGSLAQFSGVASYYMIYKNGSVYKMMGTFSNGTNINSAQNSITIKLLAGDYIDLRGSNSVTMQGGSLSATGTCNISITRVGN